MPDDPLFPLADRCETCGRPFANSRSTDPNTSGAAGADSDTVEGPIGTVRRGTHRHRLLAQFAAADLNAGEAMQRAALYAIGNSAWHRVTDLQQGGFLKLVGISTPDPVSAKLRQVLTITDKGRAMLVRLDSQGTLPLGPAINGDTAHEHPDDGA